ncbi:MAG: hypothetical protein JJ863_10030 [Deltaproteobacteria bacterium]|nr:hypothetical protein [Deltaproteobacteria bacterium]
MRSKEKSAPRGEGRRRVPLGTGPGQLEELAEREEREELASEAEAARGFVEPARSTQTVAERRARRAERRRRATTTAATPEEPEEVRTEEPHQTVTMNPIVPILWLVVPLVLLVLWTYLEPWLLP